MRKPQLLARIPAVVCALGVAVCPPSRLSAQAAAEQPLGRAEYLQRVVESNRSIQSRLAGFHSARSLHRAERGVYEPVFIGSTERVDRQRPNTIELERSLRSGGEFIERNWNYNAGVETRTPTGGRVRVGVQGRELRNNIQRTVIVDLDAEYETSFGVNVDQPLLKNAGPGVMSATRRMSARNAETAYQDFRRQLMLTLAQAEIGYWELFLAQQAVRFSGESVRTAEDLLKDNRSRFESGRGSRLEVLEAEAGLALRRSRESVAQQRLVEAMNRMAAYFGSSPAEEGRRFVAVDQPRAWSAPGEAATMAPAALAMSPDVLRAYRQVEMERIRLGVAKNQRLPQVDLRGSFGSAGLGFDWRSAWRDSEQINFPQWTVLLEMRVPLLAGIRERNEVRAAQQRVRQAQLNADDLEIQVRSNLDAAIRRVDSTAFTARSNGEAVSFRETLLGDRMAARDAGRVDTRAVLEAEDDLVVARLELLDSQVEHQRAVLELQLLQGNLLHNRGLEISMAELEQASREWSREGGDRLAFLRYREPASEIVPLPAPVPSADSRLEPDGLKSWLPAFLRKDEP